MTSARTASAPIAARPLGIPLTAAGYELVRAQLHDDRVVLAYRGHGADVEVFVRAPTEKIPRFSLRKAESSPLAAALLQEVSTSIDGYLGKARDEALVEALAHHPNVPASVLFSVDGVVALLPELSGSAPPFGQRILDAYPSSDGAVVVELGDEQQPERVRILVATTKDRKAPLSIDSRVLGPTARTDAQPVGRQATVVTLVTLLLRLRAPAIRPMPSRPRAKKPADESASARNELALSTDEVFVREAELLAPTLAANERYFGSPASTARIDASVEAYALTFPPIPATLDAGPTFFLRAPDDLRARRVMREYLGALGYRVHGDGLIRTVPTPESLRRLLAAQGLHESGFEMTLTAIDDWRVDPASWLDAYLRLTIDFNAASPRFYRKHWLLLQARFPNKTWCEHLTSIGHDMSVHVLATHRVPRASLRALSSRLAETVAECRARGRDDALLPLVMLYEGDLVSHCSEIWEALGRPEDFADAYETAENRGALDEVVGQRIAETQACLSRSASFAGAATRTVRGFAQGVSGVLGLSTRFVADRFR